MVHFIYVNKLEVCYLEAVPAVSKFLKDAIEPWLDGSFHGNGFLYERKYVRIHRLISYLNYTMIIITISGTSSMQFQCLQISILSGG